MKSNVESLQEKISNLDKSTPTKEQAVSKTTKKSGKSRYKTPKPVKYPLQVPTGTFVGTLIDAVNDDQGKVLYAQIATAWPEKASHTPGEPLSILFHRSNMPKDFEIRPCHDVHFQFDKYDNKLCAKNVSYTEKNVMGKAIANVLSWFENLETIQYHCGVGPVAARVAAHAIKYGKIPLDPKDAPHIIRKVFEEKGLVPVGIQPENPRSPTIIYFYRSGDGTTG